MRISDWSSDVCSSDLPTSIDWDCRVSHDLNFSNRPVRTRMPGGVAGERSAMLTAPYADYLPCFQTTTAPVGAVVVARWIGRRCSACRSADHTSELHSLMSISYAVYCFENKTKQQE